MNEKTCKFGKTAASVALAASLGAYAVAPACAYAADGQAKDEIVYAKASSSGSTEGVYVVNVFDSENAEHVDDPPTTSRWKTSPHPMCWSKRTARFR